MPKTKEQGAVIIKPDGSSLPYIPKNGRTLSSDEMQKIVGGYIQIVSDGKVAMVMDEEGKLKDKRLNRYATTIARAMRMIFPTDYVVGDVILCPLAILRI